MKTLRFAAAALAVAVLGVAASAEDKTATQTVVECAVGNPNFSTLVECIKTAGLAETLSGDGPFTVFAPTNDAFKKLGEDTIKAVLADKEKLTKILKAHVVAGKVMAADAIQLDGKMAKTLNGEQPIKVADGKVMIGKATVTKADIKCKNGVIHVIDTVIIPD